MEIKVSEVIQEKLGERELVVYIIGAGFSAPLGIPTMGNFISKSRDQLRQNREKFAYFEEVFHDFGRLHKVMNFFSSDQHNIEEILSILEMDEYGGGLPEDASKRRDRFLRYLSDVVRHHTPEIVPSPRARQLEHRWAHSLITDRNDLRPYTLMVANLFCLKVKWQKDGGILFPFFNIDPDTRAAYSVISLNYDRILESVCEALNKKFHGASSIPLKWATAESAKSSGGGEVFLPYLAKLHGSVPAQDTEPPDIVPPTWSKGRISESVEQAWVLARALLANASHIRVLGYSLPESDAYIRHLLKSGILDNYNLKSFEILCLDDDGTVRARYERLLRYPSSRFLNASIAGFLSRLSKSTSESGTLVEWTYNELEASHSDIFRDADRLPRS